MAVTYEKLPEGYRVYNGELMVGVITTKQHASTDDKGKYLRELTGDEKTMLLEAVNPTTGVSHRPVVWDDLPACEQSIHFCSPTMSLDLLRQVASSLPANG